MVVVAAAASWILTRFMSSSYTATATVLFKAQSQDVTPLPRLENYDSTRSDYYETKYALMGSPRRAGSRGKSAKSWIGTRNLTAGTILMRPHGSIMRCAPCKKT
ncbi:Capsular polysaccharide synthesis enzyme CpsD [Klebsiella michiganensis]|uniref:Capsular polysaccharide synthesis enzyme CpsD n=1 Tax=Klebsiella michiganensis TaxID=1134687 RepID=A0A7H4N6V4_9ENTR|nr:Capsular polysaccharide synthesis enzyme CpsD [Klebsiella michiganensis]